MAAYTNFKNQPLRLLLPDSYTTDADGGIYKIKKTPKKDAENEKILVSHVPLLPTALFKNIENDKEKLEISFCINNVWRKITAGREVFANSRKIIDLAAYGLPVDSGNARLMTVFISDMLVVNAQLIKLVKSTSHFGWADNENGEWSEFVPYSQTVKFDGDIHSVYAGTIKQCGSLEDWCNFIEPFRLRNIEIRLMIDASFASALVYPCHALPFIVNIWGPSGCGKTVSLKIAASVWGTEKFVRTLNSTQNALIMSASELKSLPLCGDELQTLKNNNSDNFDSLIYQLAEGIPRGRLTQDSRLDASMKLSWGLSFIFTGEEPIAKPNSGAGMINRIIEIECINNLISSNEGQQICEFLSSNYGTAGKHFIEHLPSHDKLRHEFREWSRCIEDATNATGKQSSAMALILVADDLLRQIFWKDEPALSPLVADPCLNFSRYLKTNVQIDGSLRAYDYIINLIGMNVTKFAEEGPIGKDTIDSKEIWGKFIKDEGVTQVWFNKSKLEAELKKAGFSFDACKKSWADQGVLIKSKSGKYATSQSICKVKITCVKLRYDE